MFDRIVGIVWLLASIAIAALTVRMSLAPPADWTGWAVVAVMGGVLAASAFNGLREVRRPGAQVPPAISSAGKARPAIPDFDGGRVPLETQIESLAAAGLVMAPGASVDDLLRSKMAATSGLATTASRYWCS